MRTRLHMRVDLNFCMYVRIHVILYNVHIYNTRTFVCATVRIQRAVKDFSRPAQRDYHHCARALFSAAKVSLIE